MVPVGLAEADPPTSTTSGRLIGRPSWRWLDTSAWGPRRVGVAAVLVVFAVLGGLNAMTVPLLVPRDETGHISYVVSITHGHLPTIYSPLPKKDVPQLQKNHTDTIWVANHPPLFYVAAAVPMKIALLLDRPSLGIRLVRLLNVGFVMVTMLLAAVLARRLLRRSRRAPIVAAATTGLITTVPHTAALAYNDAAAMATAAALAVAALAVFDRGPSTRRLAWVAGTASAAALTRFTNLAVIAAAAAVVVIGVLRHTPGPFKVKAGGVARAAGIVGFPLLVSSAWFYVRNRHLYGDFTGAHDLLVMFHRRAHGTVWTYLSSGRFWRSIHDDLWTRYTRATSSTTYGHGWPLDAGRALSAVFAVGLLCALARWIWLRLDHSRRRSWSPDLWLGLVACGETAVFFVMIAQFQTGGGSAHSRYLFPLLPVIGCFVALAWASLPGNRRGVLSVGALFASVVLAGDLLHRLLVRLVGDAGWIGTEINAMSVAVPASAAVFMTALLVLGVAVGIAAWALFALPPDRLLRRSAAASMEPPGEWSAPAIEPQPDPDPAPVGPVSVMPKPGTIEPHIPLDRPV